MEMLTPLEIVPKIIPKGLSKFFLCPFCDRLIKCLNSDFGDIIMEYDIGPISECEQFILSVNKGKEKIEMSFPDVDTMTNAVWN